MHILCITRVKTLRNVTDQKQDKQVIALTILFQRKHCEMTRTLFFMTVFNEWNFIGMCDGSEDNFYVD